MNRSSRMRGEIAPAPLESTRSAGDGARVYAPVPRGARLDLDPRDAAIECRDFDPEWDEPERWADWTDRFVYTASRAWPESRPGGEA